MNEGIKEGRNERRNQSGEKKGRNERAGRKEGTKRSTGMKRKVHGIKQTKKFICLVKRVRKEWSEGEREGWKSQRKGKWQEGEEKTYNRQLGLLWHYSVTWLYIAEYSMMEAGTNFLISMWPGAGLESGANFPIMVDCTVSAGYKNIVRATMKNFKKCSYSQWNIWMVL